MDNIDLNRDIFANNNEPPVQVAVADAAGHAANAVELAALNQESLGNRISNNGSIQPYINENRISDNGNVQTRINENRINNTQSIENRISNNGNQPVQSFANSNKSAESLANRTRNQSVQSFENRNAQSLENHTNNQSAQSFNADENGDMNGFKAALYALSKEEVELISQNNGLTSMERALILARLEELENEVIIKKSPSVKKAPSVKLPKKLTDQPNPDYRDITNAQLQSILDLNETNEDIRQEIQKEQIIRQRVKPLSPIVEVNEISLPQSIQMKHAPAVHESVAPELVEESVAPESVAPELVEESVAPESVAPELVEESVAPESVAPELVEESIEEPNAELVAESIAESVAPESIAESVEESIAESVVNNEFSNQNIEQLSDSDLQQLLDSDLISDKTRATIERIKASRMPKPVAKPVAKPIAKSVKKPIVIEESSPEPNAFASIVDEELLQVWNEATEPEDRDMILAEMQRRDLFPSDFMNQWEQETGAYPDVIDPEFLQKLLSKREFAESLQHTWRPRVDPCEDQSTFEVTPVQRFVANFMSPKTPYMSALLFHGVGVGKTCAAVQIIEAWLEVYSRNEIFLVAPPTIQQGFFRTIFDSSKVIIGQGTEPNSASQCTGTTYMKLTNTLYERDREKITKAVNKAIKRRYKVFGYISFANYIRDKLKGIPANWDIERKQLEMKKIIRKHFSGRLLIVDEAHNLRDVVEEVQEDSAYAGGKAEKGDAEAGKALTPYLEFVLQYAEGMKFCALTATPMYNTYKEIIFMLNLLLMNDKKATIKESDIFDKQGTILDKGAKRLSWIASRYVSFMRGENPISFPIRLFPNQIPEFPDEYPSLNPRGTAVPEAETAYHSKLPLVPIPLQGDPLRATLLFSQALPATKKGGMSPFELDKLIHAGNIVFPAMPSTQGDSIEAYLARTNRDSIGIVFKRQSSAGEPQYIARNGNTEWMVAPQLVQYSPKFNFFVERAKRAEGCIFAYTRFVEGGAIPFALILEANGYKPWGRSTGLLGHKPKDGYQCALCEHRSGEHPGNHEFTQAYYGILTGDKSISPDNEKTIKAQRHADNATGIKMKVLIGSQIASEGVDLRFVRETHIIDSWYHLNKTEQILGRAIRFLSHCALPQEKRNNTVYLYTAVLPGEDRETADLYSYRIGFNKAVLIGNVTRIMKQSAIDCNLNKNAIIISGEDTVRQVDSQRQVREEVDINDMPFTAVCDWIETCEYQCKPQLDLKELVVDDSTYDEFSARWSIHKIKKALRAMFVEQPLYQAADFWDAFSALPHSVVVDVLREVVNNKSFQVKHQHISGYIRYCNGYYLFQPNAYADLSIPLAIRVAKFPIKRDDYLPLDYAMPEEVKEEEEAKQIESIQTVESFWRGLERWIVHLSQEDYVMPPAEVENRRLEMSQQDPKLLLYYYQIFEVVQWFHTSFHQSGINPESFQIALLQYFWDEWLVTEEQIHLVYNTDIDVRRYVGEMRYEIGKVVIHRFIDPKMGELYYLCKEGETLGGCSANYIEYIEEDPNDIHAFAISRENTGQYYGFMAIKNGEVVFKMADVPSKGEPLPRGKECAIVTNMKGHIDQLVKVGAVFTEHGLPNFDLTKTTLLTERPVKNATRACTLLDLLMRLLDVERIGGKRWFFRPVMAHYLGYKAFVRRQIK